MKLLLPVELGLSKGCTHVVIDGIFLNALGYVVFFSLAGGYAFYSFCFQQHLFSLRMWFSFFCKDILSCDRSMTTWHRFLQFTLCTFRRGPLLRLAGGYPHHIPANRVLYSMARFTYRCIFKYNGFFQSYASHFQVSLGGFRLPLQQCRLSVFCQPLSLPASPHHCLFRYLTASRVSLPERSQSQGGRKLLLFCISHLF